MLWIAYIFPCMVREGIIRRNGRKKEMSRGASKMPGRSEFQAEIKANEN